MVLYYSGCAGQVQERNSAHTVARGEKRARAYLRKGKNTMDVSEIITIINTVGFPIVVAGALFWYMTRESEMHKSEMQGMKEAIEELKLAIVQLTALINNKTL